MLQLINNQHIVTNSWENKATEINFEEIRVKNE